MKQIDDCSRSMLWARAALMPLRLNWYIITLIIGLFYSIGSYAQIPTKCGSVNCTSNDVQVTFAKIADENGNFLLCSGTSAAKDAYLFLTVSTKTSRVGVYLSATLMIDNKPYPVSNCFSDALNGSNNILRVKLPDGVFTCGSRVALNDIFTAWGTGTTSFCQNPTDVNCPETKSKCRFISGEAIIVQTTPCSQPTIRQHPGDNTKCANSSVTFTGAYDAINNDKITTSHRWQICTSGNCDAESAWSNLTISSPYSESLSLSSNVQTTTLTINPVGVSLNGYKYRLLVISTTNDSNIPVGDRNCPIATNAATLTINPTTTGGSAGSAQTVCYGSVPSSLSLTGHTGNVLRWESSTTSASAGFNAIDNTTGQTSFSPGALTQTTWFRAVVQSGVCSSANSAAVEITVSPTTVGGSVGSAQTVCHGSAPSLLSLTGHTGNVLRWESSTTSASAGFTSISNTAGQTSFSPGALTQTTWFRAVVQSSMCAPANSAAVQITVSPTTAGGSVSSGQTICYNTAPSALTLSNNVGSVLKWQKSTVSDFSSNVSDISSTATTLASATIGSLTQDTWFRAVVKSGVCSEANSNAVKITVKPATAGGGVTSNQSVCVGNQPLNNLTLSNHVGDIISWERSTSADFSSNVTNINNTTTTLTASSIGSLTQDTWFRAVVQSGTGCATIRSSAAKISVYSNLPEPALSILLKANCTAVAKIVTSTGEDYGNGFLFKVNNGNWTTESTFDYNLGEKYKIEVKSSDPNNPCITSMECGGGVGLAATSSNSLQTTEQAKADDQLTAYPIPFSQNVTLEFKAERAGKYEINLYDMKGQLIRQLKSGTAKAGEVTQIEVDGRSMADGMYLARMVSGSGSKTVKLLKKNN